MKNIAFLTTIFPMKNEYLYDFLNSLIKQTYKYFDVIVVNDGYENFDKIKNMYKKLNIIELTFSNTIAKNREYGINYIIDNGYDVLIFGDSDDYFSENRIKKSIEFLNKFDIIVNDLSLFNKTGVFCSKYISNRVENNTSIQYEFIKDKNIFGLSNTALNVKILDKVTFDNSLVAVDWFLYKKLLKQQYTSIFTNEIETFYRQYENNTVGLNPENNKYLLWWEDAGILREKVKDGDTINKN